MNETRSAVGLQVLTAACIPAHAKRFGVWQVHGFNELCLITDGSILLGVHGSELKLPSNTLMLFRKEERHACLSKRNGEPNFWTLFFRSDGPIFQQFPGLNDPDPARRIRTLTKEQVVAYKSLFIKILTECAADRGTSAEAAAAWLYLMLVMAQRWMESEDAAEAALSGADGEQLKLPEKINATIQKAAETSDSLDLDWPDPKSLPPRFRKILGSSHHNI